MVEVKTLAEIQALIAAKRIVFVDFFTTWCYPCQKFAERVDSEVVPMIHDNADVAFVKCQLDGTPDAKDAMKWASALGMEVVPTVAVFKDGQQISVTYVDEREKKTVENAKIIRGNQIGIKKIVADIIA